MNLNHQFLEIPPSSFKCPRSTNFPAACDFHFKGPHVYSNCCCLDPLRERGRRMASCLHRLTILGRNVRKRASREERCQGQGIEGNYAVCWLIVNLSAPLLPTKLGNLLGLRGCLLFPWRERRGFLSLDTRLTKKTLRGAREALSRRELFCV